MASPIDGKWLGVAILGNSGAFESFLDQQGEFFKRISKQEFKEYSPEVIAVFEPAELAFLLASGLLEHRTVITSHKCMGLAGLARATKCMASGFKIGSKPGHFFVQDKIWQLSNCKAKGDFLGYHLDRRAEKISQSGIFVGELNSIKFISIPWSLQFFENGTYFGNKYFRKRFEDGSFLLEISPTLDTTFLRLMISKLVGVAFANQKIPRLRVRKSQKAAPRIAVRIDADGFSEESTQRVVNMSRSIGIPLTWFIDFHSWSNELDWLSELEKTGEVGMHCFFHMTFQRENDNSENFSTAMRIAKWKYLKDRGVVAPFGIATRGYMKALSKFEVPYSSEFSIANEGPPFRLSPEIKTLQIPSSPISIGSVQSSNYFELLEDSVMRQVYDFGTAVIYDHPLNRLEKSVHEFERLIKKLIQIGCEFVTMSQYAEIWESKPRVIQAQINNQSGEICLQVQDSNAVVEHDQFFEIVEEEAILMPLEEKDFDIQYARRVTFSEPLVFRTIFYKILSRIPLKFHLAWHQLRHRQRAC